MSNTDSDAQDGMAWDSAIFGAVPRWTRLPDIDAVAATCCRALECPDNSCAGSFLAAGAFNRVYLVTGPALPDPLILRASLPVYPKYKTAGEVETMRWIQAATGIPVPRVYAFSNTQDNEIGFEWILMEKMPGLSAYKCWRSMSMRAKTALVEKVAEYQSQLFRASFDGAQFRGIGTLEQAASGDGIEPVSACDTAKAARPGRMVSNSFFLGPRYSYKGISRGPFASSHDWIQAELALLRREQSDIVHAIDSKGKNMAGGDNDNDNDDDEDDDDDEDLREEAEAILEVAGKLEHLLPKLFPAIQNPPERTVIWHDDLSLQNILVDSGSAGSGSDEVPITGIIDWESVSAKPVWVAASMPKFLDGLDRADEPQRDEYEDASDDENQNRSKNGGDDDDNDALDNEGKTELYWDHLMEYEKTQLRQVYANKMAELWPRWAVEAADAHLKADFSEAVVRCAAGTYLRQITQWVDAVEDGHFPRLHDVLFSHLRGL